MAQDKAETPSESISKAAIKLQSHMDAKGRLITVSQLDALQYYRFVKAMGANSGNPAAVDMALIAAAVRKIDTTHYPIPSNEKDVEFVLQTLGFEGLAAAGLALGKFQETAEEDRKAEEEAAKN